MKFKKPRIVLFVVSTVLFAVSAVLFFLIPVICKDGFAYNAGTAALEGLKGIFSFRFSNAAYVGIFVLFCLVVAGCIAWLATLIAKKRYAHIPVWILVLVMLFGLVVLTSTYFLADVEFNSVQGKLLVSIFGTPEQILGKFLTATILVCALVSAIFLGIYIFADSFAVQVTKEMDNFVDKDEAAAAVEAAKAEALAVCAKYGAERAAEALAVAKTEEDDFEARKAREEAFLQSCVDTGYFEIYDEYEFNNPVEGFEDEEGEPICECINIEEQSALIRKKYVAVAVTSTRRVKEN